MAHFDEKMEQFGPSSFLVRSVLDRFTIGFRSRTRGGRWKGAGSGRFVLNYVTWDFSFFVTRSSAVACRILARGSKGLSRGIDPLV